MSTPPITSTPGEVDRHSLPSTSSKGLSKTSICAHGQSTDSPSLHTSPTTSKSKRTLATTRLQNAINNALLPYHSRRFKRFSLLPPELRLAIWQFALPSPVTHELYPSSPTSAPYTFKTRLRSNRPTPPALLHTCREAREVALKHFALMYYDPPTMAEPRETVAGISRFWYNPDRDTLFLNCVANIFLDVQRFLLSDTPKHITPMKGWKNIALDSLHMRYIAVVASDSMTPQHRIQQFFPDLENLSVALDSKNSARRRLRASLRPGSKTELEDAEWDDIDGADDIEVYFEKDFGEEEEEDSGVRVPELKTCRVRRDRLLVGLKQDAIYSYVGGCQFLRACGRRVLRRRA